MEPYSQTPMNYLIFPRITPSHICPSRPYIGQGVYQTALAPIKSLSGAYMASQGHSGNNHGVIFDGL